MASLTEYDRGDLVRLVFAFTVDGAATDPDEPTFTMREPDGALTTYVHGTDPELVRTGTGVYHVDWVVRQSGVHAYRCEGTGPAAAAEEGRFLARRSAVLPEDQVLAEG